MMGRSNSSVTTASPFRFSQLMSVSRAAFFLPGVLFLAASSAVFRASRAPTASPKRSALMRAMWNRASSASTCAAYFLRNNS